MAGDWAMQLSPFGKDMAKADIDSDWFEVSDKDWLPNFKPKELKLLADAQVPEQIVEEISSAGISIKSLPLRTRNRSDMAILQMAERSRRILLTLDRDFWNDRWYPLHIIQQGIIFVDEDLQTNMTAFCEHSGCCTAVLPRVTHSTGGAT